MRKYVLALVAVFSLVFATACGASGGEESSNDDSTTTTEAGETTVTTEAEAETIPVDEWAEGFCADFGDWTSTIEGVGEDIASDITPGDLEGARTAIENLFADVATETEGLIESLESGGTPDIDDGDQFVADLSEKFQGFVDATNDSKTAAAEISVDDPAAFQTEFTQLFEEFQSNINDVGDSFGELDATYSDPDLQEALTNSCDL